MKGLSFEDFCEDAKVTCAVTMDFIIIGEAAMHISSGRYDIPNIIITETIAHA